ncbi:hypothetical protein FS837_005234 [Tulasnella sp. UAMH 9824]|nr:hypothetical protein FS837_005234 [Tulasnella sp. UAMH 9824]
MYPRGIDRTASASLILPLAATWQITRRQAAGCESECTQCDYEADPTRQQELQAVLDGYLIRHAVVSSLTLSPIGAPSSTSSVRSASLISSPAITSISSTVTAASRSAASQASATGGPTGNGNGASSVAAQMTGAFVAAGVAAVLAVL